MAELLIGALVAIISLFVGLSIGFGIGRSETKKNVFLAIIRLRMSDQQIDALLQSLEFGAKK